MIRRHKGDFTWTDVPILPYKEDGTLFKDITRQTLFEGSEQFGLELRYFEIGPGGHSTLEQHDHEHVVMIIRGTGRVLVGDTVSEIGTNDIVHVPTQTWHQFRATDDSPLGFLCVVKTDRDRPRRPGPEDLADLNTIPVASEFIRF